MHDAHGTRHPTLDVLKGGGREAHPQLVTQNVPRGRMANGDRWGLTALNLASGTAGPEDPLS